MKKTFITLEPLILKRQGVFTLKSIFLLSLAFLFTLGCYSREFSKINDTQPTIVIPLDGNKWLIDIDPNNTGIANKWFNHPTEAAKQITIPGIIQTAFPNYHGLAWCWLDFKAPVNPHPNGRFLLKFKSVNYKADVWVNGVHLMSHEGIESPFEVDATVAIKHGTTNRLAVRILNVTDTPIDGLSFANVPVGYKTNTYTPGYLYNEGGIIAPVYLEIKPAIYLQNIFVQPITTTGEIVISATIINSEKRWIFANIAYKVTPELGGNSITLFTEKKKIQPGINVFSAKLGIENPVLWDVDNPFLYNLALSVQRINTLSVDETIVRFGLREFRFENGFFSLNGKRIFVKGVALATSFPAEYSVVDKNLLMRDVINLKAMGFNAIRNTISMVPEEFLDLCDELGVLVFREPLSSCAYIPGISGGFDNNSHWKASMDTLKRQRWINTCIETIVRDRNHPSIVVWGVVNETPAGPMLNLARELIPQIRMVDNSRIVNLNSGMNAAIATTDGNVSHEKSSLDIDNMSNTGSPTWDILLNDVHAYKEVPHTSEVVNEIRKISPNLPLMITESGVGSANNLINTVRKFEQMGRSNSADAIYAGKKLKQFMADWEQWHLTDTWTRPEKFFKESWINIAKFRIENYNVFRANPNLITYFNCGLYDIGVDGVGMTTTFRDLKNGNVDAMVNINAPLRWSLFTDPVHIYSGTKIRLEALLSNDGILKAGNYPVRLQVFDPHNKIVYEKKLEVVIKEHNSASSFVTPVLQDDVVIDGPSGTYKFIATLDKGGVAAADEQLFYVSDKKDLPLVSNEVVLWGEDDQLTEWLTNNGIKVRPFKAGVSDKRELILISKKAYGNGALSEFTDLAERIAKGSSAVFLSPDVFYNKNDKTTVDRNQLAPHVRNFINLDFAPLKTKGFQALINCVLGYYRKDDWAKDHPVFAGMPSGGIMDLYYYRNIVPFENVMMNIQNPEEAVSGTINASIDYSSGLYIGVYKLGSGRFIINNLQILENLGNDPAAERLLRNMLNYLAVDAKNPLDKLPADWEDQLIKIGYK